MLPIESFDRATAHAATAVLTDIDDTLTDHGRLPAEVHAALRALQEAGLIVVPVTGRPAGWCDLIARQWYVDGVVGENGALWFSYDTMKRKMLSLFARDIEQRKDDRRRLKRIGDEVLLKIPGAALASDQDYRVSDLAIDYCEDVDPLPRKDVESIVDIFQAHGAIAKVSSIHVNGWFGNHDKLSMSRRALSSTFGLDIDVDRDRILFVGDSPNDAPMFAHFPNAVGVANIRAFEASIEHLPRYVTNAPAAQGFVEFAARLLSLRQS
jgi:HAD superfamily hydrolase (TIGR01484 family)